LIPREAGVVFAEQAFSDRTICAVTTDDVVAFYRLLARGRLTLHPCLVAVLSQAGDFMLPADGTVVLFEEQVEHQLDEILEDKTRGPDIAINVLEAFAVETGNITVIVWIPPAH